MRVSLMQKLKVPALAALLSLTFCGAGRCEDAGEATRTSSAIRPSSNHVAGYEQICHTLRDAAIDNGLPVDFLVKLIWQESRFDPLARSRAGARGIAQFMPMTALSRGLLNAFDPVEALKESASYLRELERTFGNLGLAAAAYNAGPNRLTRWLAGRTSLPLETLSYVQIVTGKPIAEWSSAGSRRWEGVALPKDVPCDPSTHILTAPEVSEVGPLVLANWTAWGVQLLGNWTQGELLADFEKLRRTHSNVLGDKDPMVVVAYGPSGMSKRFLLRVGADTRESAERLCAKLRQEKIPCFAICNPTKQEVAAKSARFALLLSRARGYGAGR